MCFVLKIGHFVGFPTPPFGNACHQHLGKAMNHLKFLYPSLFPMCPLGWQHPGAALAKQKGPPGDLQGRPCRPFSSKSFNLFKLRCCKSKIAIGQCVKRNPEKGEKYVLLSTFWRDAAEYGLFLMSSAIFRVEV
jgi:hypothetical protein